MKAMVIIIEKKHKVIFSSADFQNFFAKNGRKLKNGVKLPVQFRFLKTPLKKRTNAIVFTILVLFRPNTEFSQTKIVLNSFSFFLKRL